MDTLATIILALVSAWLLLIGWLWLIRPRDVGMTDLVRVVPDIARLVRNVLGDATAPGSVRIALVVLLVWLVSPIDLIPEFIPVLGPLDDVIVAVLILRFVARRLGVDGLRRRWPGTDEGWGVLARLLKVPHHQR